MSVETDFQWLSLIVRIYLSNLKWTLNLAMDKQFIIHTPLMWINKAETWKLADELGALDFVRTKTLTCYNGIIAEGVENVPLVNYEKGDMMII